MSSFKFIQTEVDPETYRILRAIAIHRGVPLKEVLREIMRDYTEAQRRELIKKIHEDPIWKGIGMLKTRDPEESEKDTWGVIEWQSE
ncbi:MAG: hypothetical protein H5T47_07250 [Archaeoglobi archaeon]|nr:hypothetical protein [Candidatus Mnemosynella bozhongmuii]